MFRRWQRCIRFVGIALIVLGVILVLASLPNWMWIFFIGLALCVLGVALLCR